MHLGCVVYVWGFEEQDRLLTDFLGPLVRELRQQGEVLHFFFDRYDARGSHLFCVLTPRDADLDGLRSRLDDRLASYLDEHPSRVELPEAELQERHRQCRGRLQCEVDGYPGLAENNTYVLFEHPDEGTPFSLPTRLPADRREELWELTTDLCTWSIDQIGRIPPGQRARLGLSWLAAVDRQLRRTGADAAGYWRFHASTLILSLEERLAEDEGKVLSALPGLVGPQNRRVFDDLWRRVEEPEQVWPALPRLVELALADAGPDSEPGGWLLRDLDHTLLKQLAISGRVQVPLVLYAWLRSLPAPGAGAAQPSGSQAG